jgi:hypothetical protein
MLKVDGYDEAIIGVTERCGAPDVYVYDKQKIVDIIVERDGCSEEDAIEFVDYNIIGSYMGEETPIFIYVFSHDFPQEALDSEWPM